MTEAVKNAARVGTSYAAWISLIGLVIVLVNWFVGFGEFKKQVFINERMSQENIMKIEKNRVEIEAYIRELHALKPEIGDIKDDISDIKDGLKEMQRSLNEEIIRSRTEDSELKRKRWEQLNR